MKVDIGVGKPVVADINLAILLFLPPQHDVFTVLFLMLSIEGVCIAGTP